MCPNLYFYVFMYVCATVHILHLYACAYVFDQDLHHDQIICGKGASIVNF